jgi:hypothetical protein
MRNRQKIPTMRRANRVVPQGWHRVVALGLLLALLPGCGLNLTQVLIPLGYASIGVGIALLVSPSVSAAVVGFVLGGIIGAAVYNNSLKADLMERQGLGPAPVTGK